MRCLFFSWGGPANKFLISGGALKNKFLSSGWASANKFLFPGLDLANNLFLNKMLCIVECSNFTLFHRHNKSETINKIKQPKYPLPCHKECTTKQMKLFTALSLNFFFSYIEILSYKWQINQSYFDFIPLYHMTISDHISCKAAV